MNSVLVVSTVVKRKLVVKATKNGPNVSGSALLAIRREKTICTVQSVRSSGQKKVTT